MHEITIKGDTPATTVAMLLSLARPHFVRVGVPANDTAEQPAIERQEPAVRDASGLAEGAQQDNQALDTGRASDPATGTRRATSRRSQKSKIIVTVKWPDGSDKTFETVSEAVEAMADALDLCDSKDDVRKFLNDNIVVTEQVSDAVRDALTSAANERIQDILKAEAAEGGASAEPDPLPASDQIGPSGGSEQASGAAAQPDELALPKHLDRRTADPNAPVPSLDYIKKVFIKFSELNPKGVSGAQQVLIDAGSTKKPPNLSSVPEANRAALVAAMRKHVPTDVVPEE